ncbi:MAG: glycosyltransferase [Gammaproteobacteria bacterium]|nr:glycosyltransferase [Gammaproteobacteria bacterium]
MIVALYSVTATVFYLAANLTFKPVAGLDSIRVYMLVLLMPLLVKYVFQLTSALLNPIVENFRKKRGKDERMLSVSVLIPAWNEEVGIVKTIKSVLYTHYPQLQIVIINDGSSDGTHEQVTNFIASHKQLEPQGATLEYLNVANGGKARALNRALLEATGEIVITIDADSVMDPDAITNLVRCFSSPDVGAVAGNVIVGNRRKPIEWMQQLEYVYGFFFKRADSVFNSVYIIGGAAAAYRREVLQEMGGFDHGIITEDIEMSTRILSHGYNTRYAADAVIYTEGPSDFKSLCNQRLRWKYGRILTFIKHRNLFFSLDRKHNSYLTLMLLPMAVYAEFLLLLEGFMLAAFLIYTILTHDYMPLASVIAILATVGLVQILVDSKRRFHVNLILLAPVAWLVFYIMDMIELQALFRSLKRLILRRELKWQKWVRVGLPAAGNEKLTN